MLSLRAKATPKIKPEMVQELPTGRYIQSGSGISPRSRDSFISCTERGTEVPALEEEPVPALEEEPGLPGEVPTVTEVPAEVEIETEVEVEAENPADTG